MKKAICLLILLSLVLLLGACGQQTTTEPSGKTIKSGIIAPFSGPHHVKGQEGLKGWGDLFPVIHTLRLLSITLVGSAPGTVPQPPVCGWILP